MQYARFVRLYADEYGVSHFEDVDVALLPVNFAPPAPPLNIVSLFPAVACGLLGANTDWGGDVPHPSPRRQLFCTMRGEYEVTASDGTRRRFVCGSLLLLEDTYGEGHSTLILDDCLILTVAIEGLV